MNYSFVCCDLNNGLKVHYSGHGLNNGLLKVHNLHGSIIRWVFRYLLYHQLFYFSVRPSVGSPEPQAENPASCQDQRRKCWSERAGKERTHLNNKLEKMSSAHCSYQRLSRNCHVIISH